GNLDGDFALDRLAAVRTHRNFYPPVVARLHFGISHPPGFLGRPPPPPVSIAATLRSGSRSRLLLTPFTSGVLTLFRYRRLNLSPSHNASAIGAGRGISPVACIVASPILRGPFISTLPFSRYVVSSAKSFRFEIQFWGGALS